MLIIIKSSNFSKFSCSKYYGHISFDLAFSKLTKLHCNMQITSLIFIFAIFFCYNILLLCNYINNIYQFQKLNITSSFKEVKIWLTQLPHSEANFTNLYITDWMLWDKICLQLGKTALSSIKLWAIWCFCQENWTLFTSDSCICKRNNSNSKTYLLNFLSVIEDKHVLLITGFSYSFTLLFSRYSTFNVILSIYFITHIILNCHMQRLVYKQNNINTHN